MGPGKNNLFSKNSSFGKGDTLAGGLAPGHDLFQQNYPFDSMFYSRVLKDYVFQGVLAKMLSHLYKCIFWHLLNSTAATSTNHTTALSDTQLCSLGLAAAS